MWLTVYNPVEQGPLSNIIRGNAFGLDSYVQNDDWACKCKNSYSFRGTWRHLICVLV